MADDADRAQDAAEQLEMLRRLRTLVPGPEPTGNCLWCDAPLANGVRWCGWDCARSWEHMESRR